MSGRRPSEGEQLPLPHVDVDPKKSRPDATTPGPSPRPFSDKGVSLPRPTEGDSACEICGGADVRSVDFEALRLGQNQEEKLRVREYG